MFVIIVNQILKMLLLLLLGCLCFRMKLIDGSGCKVLANLLLIMPALLLFALALVPVHSVIGCTMLVASACPSAATGTAFALRFHYSKKPFDTLITSFFYSKNILSVQHFNRFDTNNLCTDKMFLCCLLFSRS